MRLTNTLKDWLKQKEWDELPEINEEANTSSLSFDYSIHDFNLKCFFEINENHEIFKLYMYFFSTKCPEKSLVEVQKFVTRISDDRYIGCLQLRSEERVIRAYAAIDVENASFEPAHIQNLMNACANIMAESLPKYMAICFGDKTAEDVFAVDVEDVQEENV
jgi:hypothetical protein